MTRLAALFRTVSLLTALLWGSSASTGCNPVDYAPVVQASGKLLYINALVAFTDRVSDKQRLGVYQGIELWNVALEGGIALQETQVYLLSKGTGRRSMGFCQPVILIDVIDSTHKDVIEHDKEEGVVTLGLTFSHRCGITKVYMVGDRVQDEDAFIAIAAHEFGHAMGLDHVREPTSLMNKYYSSYTAGCVTYADAKELCNRLDCIPERIQYCD